MRRRQYDVSGLYFQFSVWTSTWGWTPVHMRPPEPDPLPLRVEVINGWPLMIGFKFPLCQFPCIRSQYSPELPPKSTPLPPVERSVVQSPQGRYLVRDF